MFLFTSLTPQANASTQAPHANALRSASAETGVSFDYLVQTARRESGFKANAQASTSSARGLFQFIDQTWLRMVRTEGARIGLGDAANAVQIDSSGRAKVADSATRAKILALRDNPEISAQLAAGLARDNAATMQARLGREVTQGELYMAHFLGPVAAARLVSLKEQSPGASAASAFPAAAEANRSIFYDRSGAARSASAVYSALTRGFEANESATTAVASVPVDESKPFHGLFRSRSASPVARDVASFWRAVPPQKRGMPLDLNAFRKVGRQAA